MRVEKLKLKILTDVLLFLALVLLWFSGTVLKSILPLGSTGRSYLKLNQAAFLGLNRHQWQSFHSLSFNLLLLFLLGEAWIGWDYVKKIPVNLKKMLKGKSIKQ